uniref:Uncharacterized protein n=1 Tax=Solanum tuberosum TaxID=4113 RepID=M1DBI3_SOLTU
MAPKGKNVSSDLGTKRSRKRAATGSSNRETTNLPPQKFGEQTVMHYEKDCWMGRMFGMADLQLRVGGRPVSEDEMVTLAERYPLTDSAMYLCQMGPTFQEPIDDDDDATVDEEDGSDEDASDDICPGDGDIDADH